MFETKILIDSFNDLKPGAFQDMTGQPNNARFHNLAPTPPTLVKLQLEHRAYLPLLRALLIELPPLHPAAHQHQLGRLLRVAQLPQLVLLVEELRQRREVETDNFLRTVSRRSRQVQKQAKPPFTHTHTHTRRRLFSLSVGQSDK